MNEELNENPIDKDKIVNNPGLTEIPHHVGSAIVKPEDKGKLRSRSIESMEHQTDLQMKQIFDQMQLLAEQANKIKERKIISELIYAADFGFEPLINHTYHLYSRTNGTNFLSMISPQQWRKKDIIFLASVVLLADYTWEIIEKSETWNINE